MTREKVIAEAKTWLRTPYHHQGRVKGVGVDCAMFLIDVYASLGLIPEDYDPRPYPPDWHLHRSEERYLLAVEKFGRKVEAPLPGDAVVYQFGRCVSHGGIVVEWPTIIHSYREDGVIFEDGVTGRLSGRSRGFYSLFSEGD